MIESLFEISMLQQQQQRRKKKPIGQFFGNKNLTCVLISCRN